MSSKLSKINRDVRRAKRKTVREGYAEYDQYVAEQEAKKRKAGLAK